MYRTLASLVQLSEWYSPATKGGLQNRHMRGFLRVLSHFLLWFCECSVQYSRSVVSDSLQPHRLQHTRFPYPSQTPGACSNSCPSNWWCYPTISSSVIPFAFCLQYFPASGFFLMNQLLASDSQSIGASTSDLPMNIQDWFPLGLIVWAPCSPRDSQESSPTPQFKSFHSFEHFKSIHSLNIQRCSAFFMVQLSYPYMTTGKTIALTRQTFVGKVMSLLFNMVSRFVIAFLPRNKHLLISWLQSPSAVNLEY